MEPHIFDDQAMIQNLIFDLDDTLLDTSRILIPIANTSAFEARIKQKLDLMPGALENLQLLHRRYKLYLLTIGRTHFQKQKIASLAIDGFYHRIDIIDSSQGHSKMPLFRQICADSGAPPGTFLSIGNRRSMDIREAKMVQMQTCLFRYGEYSDEKAEVAADFPDFEVNHHQELIAKCGL
ncbi:MAG: hypothetical protein C5B49_03950 [Bdellovibrio sp.]|nr:MAG: hypothetical protein C5B49_03950 [Bdellovibrio sp.]